MVFARKNRKKWRIEALTEDRSDPPADNDEDLVRTERASSVVEQKAFRGGEDDYQKDAATKVPLPGTPRIGPQQNPTDRLR